MVAHNGILTQVNPWFLYLAQDFPFLNHLKNSSSNKLSDNVSRIDPTKHDSDGWMHTVYGLSSGGGVGVYVVFAIPTQAQRPGNYVMKWTGGGSLSLSSMAHTYVSGGLTGAHRRYVLTPQTNAGVLKMYGVADAGVDYPHDIIFCHVDDEALIDAGEVFSPLFKTEISKSGVFRDLDWSLGNTATIVNWADRMPLTYHSWASGRTFPLSKYAVTTNSGDAYSVTPPVGYVRADKSQMVLKFSATSSGVAPTLDDGGGAVPIRNKHGGELIASLKPVENAVGLVTYENRRGCYLLSGGNWEDAGIITGVPPELTIRLCRETGMDPWFVQPLYTADPPSDYMPGLIQLCKDTLNA